MDEKHSIIKSVKEILTHLKTTKKYTLNSDNKEKNSFLKTAINEIKNKLMLKNKSEKELSVFIKILKNILEQEFNISIIAKIDAPHEHLNNKFEIDKFF